MCFLKPNTEWNAGKQTIIKNYSAAILQTLNLQVEGKWWLIYSVSLFQFPILILISYQT